MEEKKDCKKSEELLAEVYRNCQLALESISDILPEIEDEPRQHEEYEKISARAAMLAKDKALEVKEPSVVKKAMMKGSVKMNTLTDNSRSHIADMMIRGTVMGLTSLKTSYGERPENDDEEISAVTRDLIALEESFEAKLKEYL